MPVFFDTEERSRLETQLGRTYSTQSGLSPESFQIAIESVLSTIELHGFDKHSVKAHIRSSDHVPNAAEVERLVDVVWTPIFTKAEELAKASWQGGLSNFLVWSLVLLALGMARLKVLSNVVRDSIPSWLTSEWIFFLAAIGVLTCAVHVVRGGITLAQLRRATRYSTVTRSGDTPRLLDLKRARLHLSVPSVKQTILLLIGICTVFVGSGIAKATLDTIFLMPPQLIDRVVFGLVLWFMVCAIGLMLMGFAVAIPGRPYCRLDSRGAEIVLGALFSWQIAILGLLVVGDAVRSLLRPTLFSFFLAVTGFITARLFAARASSQFARARQHMTCSTDEILRTHRVTPILYLRSFSADLVPAPYLYSTAFRRWNPFNLLRFTSWTQQRDMTFEEVVCKGMSRIGPVIAIGEPGEPLPKLGAFRKYVAHEDWQTDVKRLILKCQFVCLVVGRSDGLLWEFEQLVRYGDGTRLVLLVPKGLECGFVWESFVVNCKKHGVDVKLPLQMPEDALGICFDKGWLPSVIVGEPIIDNYRAIARHMSHSDCRHPGLGGGQ